MPDLTLGNVWSSSRYLHGMGCVNGHHHGVCGINGIDVVCKAVVWSLEEDEISHTGSSATTLHLSRAGFGGSHHQYRWKGVQVFSGVSWVGITPGRRRSGRLPWGWGRHVGASFDAQKQPGVRCHVHRRGGPCDRWLSPPNYEEGLGRCPSAGVRRRGCWLARNTQIQRLLPGVRNKNRWVCPPDMSKVWR